MSTTQVTPAEGLVIPHEVAQIVPSIVKRAQEIAIETNDDYEEAGNFIKWVTGQKKRFLEWFDPHVQRAHASWKSLVAERDSRIGPADEARKLVEGKMSRYLAAKEAERKATEERLREQAKKKQDEEAMARAAELEASGEKELAQVVLENALAAPAPVVVVESSVPEVRGVSKPTERWKFRYKDGELAALRTLLKAAMSNDNLLGYLTFNETAIGATVRSQKGMTNIPGIEVYPEQSFSVQG